MPNRSRPLPLIFLWLASSLLLSCGGSQVLAPQYVAEQPNALAVDSLLQPDAATLAYIQPYKLQIDSLMNQVIGQAARELPKGEIESPLGNFVADLIEESVRASSSAGVDMGVITTGGVRIPLPKGPLTRGDIFELMPFENMLQVLELSGEQTLRLFEHAARVKNLAISNSQLLVRGGQIERITIGGKPFDPAKTYRIATSDYLAGGGDHLGMLKEARVLEYTDILLRDAIVAKIQALQAQGLAVDARVEGRVIIE
ncbi:5'-nucleotidase C-terminal domain-containing protein [Cesiribacter andamanensis]|uniref:Trifunctional nucleotide phosphoesterase protein YfkN n=1 Tax=Cesiribacter andamanensis AMV16 TaxID=1279009 RepID=M7N203_9BACT|nr:5'-nucleotidase [Cesiribacter andamanensis]EMR01322.1 Trifunctional nucleotide phosphoesterase protein YfkN precursor [Cesiribacter andamanensis AMV16]